VDLVGAMEEQEQMMAQMQNRSGFGIAGISKHECCIRPAD
jgi:hypothetical protein